MENTSSDLKKVSQWRKKDQEIVEIVQVKNTWQGKANMCFMFRSSRPEVFSRKVVLKICDFNKVGKKLNKVYKSHFGMGVLL